MQSKNQDAIFQEFKQLHSKELAQGLGLGLAISKRICEVLEIPITLGSQLNKGTQFTLTLPSFGMQTDQKTEVTADKPSGDSQLSGLSIWLLDNDANALNALSQVLLSWGCQVAVARDEAELSALQATRRADMLIADYQLDHGVTGLEVIAALALDDMPIIINTANHDEAIRERVSDAGIPLLYKPLKTPALKRMIKRLI